MQVKDFLRTEVTGNNVSFNGLGLGLGSGSIARNNVMAITLTASTPSTYSGNAVQILP
ncbi:MAG: hypothetical protein N3F10_07525 [Candidatus Bathyarchaeota archaeon]|nr:hypothetical protein [Candidatus Bathyarchaeota archaeon]MCX8178121.1 hypothetical protein [Candidatus Bathyarchaeota archaeon]MDW8194483.1 hypothetical protein [Nitrososphaerota archaeon]